MINRLERAGYAHRRPDPADRRRVRVVPDPAATARVVAVYEPFYVRLAAVFAEYTPDEVAVIADWFGRVTVEMRAHLAEVRAAEPGPRRRSGRLVKWAGNLRRGVLWPDADTHRHLRRAGSRTEGYGTRLVAVRGPPHRPRLRARPLHGRFCMKNPSPHGRFGIKAGAKAGSRPGAKQAGGGKTPRTLGPQGEFAMPRTTTPALPPVASFDELGLPPELVTTLAAQEVRAPFPIQAATLPNSLAGRDILGRAAPARARPSPSAWPCWPVRRDSRRTRSGRWRWSSYPRASWRSR